MAYATKEGYPAELANKVGHVKLIQDPLIQGVIETFESTSPLDTPPLPTVMGHVDLDVAETLTQVVTIDGSNQEVPNAVRPERQVGFVQIAAQLLQLDTLRAIGDRPLMDPRDMRRRLSEFTDYTLAALPLRGMRFPHMSLRTSIREVIHRYLAHYQLYDALRFLVYREWTTNLASEQPHMLCLACRRDITLPPHALMFRCPHCEHTHRLGDYLLMSVDDGEDSGSGELVASFRSALEVLALFSTIVKARECATLMERTLFLLDGPLLLRAHLSRLVEPIRAFIADHVAAGRQLYLVGVEKTGEARAYADEIASALKEPGDCAILSWPFIVEELHARFFDPSTYRNRVNYGAKAIVRLGPCHVVVLNVATGHFVVEPTMADLIGFAPIVCFLAKLVSFRYDNALIPLVMANEAASISNQPSNGILAAFVDRILDGAR